MLPKLRRERSFRSSSGNLVFGNLILPRLTLSLHNIEGPASLFASFMAFMMALISFGVRPASITSSSIRRMDRR